MRFLVLALSLIALASCHLQTDPPGEAPAGVKVVNGDGLVVVSWDALPNLTYWIFYSAGNSVGVGSPGTVAIRRAVSPRGIGNLTNGSPYTVVMNATQDDSPAGPNSAPLPALPRLAGDTDTWVSGPVLPLGAPPQNLRSAAFSGTRFVVVGDAATVSAGDYNYTSDFVNPPGPPGVTAWLPPVAPFPVGSTVNLNSVIFNGTFVALGTDSASSTSSPVISSADGVNSWVPNVAVPAGGMNALAFAFVSGFTPTYVAVGDQGRIFTSNNINPVSAPASGAWTESTSGTGNDLTSVSFLNGKFFVTGAGGALLSSIDGISWTVLNSGTASTLRGVTFTPLGSGAHYVAVGDAGTISTSPDGDTNTWTATTLPAPAPELRSVTVGGASGTRFLAVGLGGAVVFSDDPSGLGWSLKSAGLGNTANLAKVVSVPGMYLAVGNAGANAVSR